MSGEGGFMRFLPISTADLHIPGYRSAANLCRTRAYFRASTWCNFSAGCSFCLVSFWRLYIVVCELLGMLIAIKVLVPPILYVRAIDRKHSSVYALLSSSSMDIAMLSASRTRSTMTRNKKRQHVNWCNASNPMFNTMFHPPSDFIK